MPVLAVLLLVTAVHFGTNLTAWSRVGLLADDRFAVGLPMLFELQGLSWWQRLETLFFPTTDPNATTALYRPIVGLLFTVEHGWFGVDARGYHAVNSLLHIGTATVWFVLVRRWTGATLAGLAVALAFVGWPGHTEVTHWISARVNLLALFFVSLALIVWDGAARLPAGTRRWPRIFVAMVLLLLACGSKESAILLLPLAALVSWQRSTGECPLLARAQRCAVRLLPLVLAFMAFACWRRHVLHTWGAGSGAAWQLDVLSASAWASAVSRWFALLMSPVHAFDAGAFFGPVLWVLHGGLLFVAAIGWRRRHLRPGLAFGWPAACIVVLATAGLRVDPVTLENVRYSYEPALAFTLLLGLGIAALPLRAGVAALAVVVLVHGLVLDRNRQCWLRAGAVHARMEQEIQRAASVGPVRVFNAPARYEGALVYLVENSPLLLWWPPQRPGELKGRITSANEWKQELRELADVAAGKQPLVNAFEVAFADGELLPMQRDATWPKEPWPGTAIGYARIGRRRPFVGSELPVHVWVRTEENVRLMASARVGDRELVGGTVAVDPSEGLAVLVSLPLPSELRAGEPIAVELRIAGPSGEQRWPLGTVAPVARIRE